jgi:hypothetical protein
MAGEINFGLSDPAAAFKGAAHMNGLLQQFAKVRAGQALASGAPDASTQAQDILNRSGDIEGSTAVENQHWSQQQHIKALSDAQHTESAKFAADASAALYQHLQQHKNDPDGGTAAVLAGFDQLAPVMQARGATPEDVAMYKSALAKDPNGFLTMMHNEAAAHLKRTVLKPGDTMVDEAGTTLAHSDPATQYKIVTDGDGTQHLVAVGGPVTAGAGQATADRTVPNGVPGAKVPPHPDDVFGAVIQQESGGKPGVSGPPTQYGTAHGEGQLLDSTAEGVAKKLGIKWEPARMTGTSPEDEAYQLKLSRAYLQEGLDKYNGDVPKALAYYYGGPDERRWGPKTRAYVTQVLSRLEPTQSADASGQVGAASGSVPVNEIFKGSPKPKDNWTLKTAGEGDPNFRPGTTYQVNAKTGETRKLQDPLSPTGGKGGAKLSQPEQSYLTKLRQQADELQNVTGSVDEFLQLNKNVKTGGGMALPGVGGVLSTVNPSVARMTSITSKLTPAMRNGLPGAASDKDVAMFKNSTVGIDKPYEANAAIAKGVKALTNRVGDHVAFLEAYGKANGTLLGSQELWKKYVDDHPLFAGLDKNGALIQNKITPWREAIPMGGSGGSAAPTSGAPRKRVYDPATGTFTG